MAGVASHPPSSHSRASWGKRRRIRFFAHRLLMSPGFSSFVSLIRLVGSVSCLICPSPVDARCDGCVLRVCSWRSHRRRSVMRSSCGVAACLASSIGPSSRPASRRFVSWGVSLLVSHILRAWIAWRACPSRRVVPLVSSGVSSSRGAGSVRLLVLSRRERMGGGSRRAVSEIGACLS